MSDTNLETPPQISKPFPQVIQVAQELINANPDLFKNDCATLLAIGNAMFNYKEAYEEWKSNLPSLADRMIDPLADVKKQVKSIGIPIAVEPDFEYLHSREESIMNRGIDADRNRF